MKTIKTWIIVICLMIAMTGCRKHIDDTAQPALEVYNEDENTRALGAVNQSQQAENALIQSKVSTKKKKNFTLMIYMIGSNLESHYGAASNDLREIENADVDYRKTNVLVYTGGSRRWNSDISSEYNSILDMSKDKDRLVAQTEKTSDMGAPETLSHFINFATTYYPAENYGLICWDHGGGPLWGYGSDELYSYDSLLLKEIKTAMSDTIFNKDNKLAFVGYDACLMGTLESAALWQEYASYLIASEEVEAGAGWDYSFLKAFTKSGGTEDVLASIVDTFGDYYKNNQTQFSHPDATLAAIDLTKTGSVVTALNALTNRLSKDIKKNYNALSKLRSETKTFGLSAVASKGEGYDLIDLGHLTQKLDSLYPQESQALLKALQDAVVKSTSNVENTFGLSIYFPGDNKNLYKDSLDVDYEEIAVSKEYVDFMKQYADEWLKTSTIDWKLGDLKKNGQEYTMQLSEAQQNAMMQAYYTILKKDENRYFLTSCNIKLTPDDKGVLHVPADPSVFVGTTDTDRELDNHEWMFMQSEENDTSETYRSVAAYFLHSPDFADMESDVDLTSNIVIRRDKKTGKVEVTEVYSADDTDGSGGKNTVDVTHYKAIACYMLNYALPSHNDDGTLDPYYNWANGGMYGYFYLDFDEDFAFKSIPLSEMNNDYYVQVTIRDVNGLVHGSDLTRINQKKDNTVSVKTDHGKMNFELKKDHAEFAGYSGSDQKLVIPETVNDLPVTVITSGSRNETVLEITLPKTVKILKERALSSFNAVTKINLNEGLETISTDALSCSKLTDVKLPSTVKKVGRTIFDRSSVKQINIPASLETIAEGAFIRMKELTHFTVDEGNQVVKAVDGVLYSKDGTILISYPAKKGTSYKIEEGTKEIDYGAFGASGIEEITFPSSLEKIDNAAFFNCDNLKPFTLPDSLTYLGTYAFGAISSLNHVEKHEVVVDTVKIGKNVSYIGKKVFNNVNLKAIEVDDHNEYYGSLGGFLTNKAKDTIIEAPLGHTTITIPAGIVTLNKNVFEEYSQTADFIFPNSTYRFPTELFNYSLVTNEETKRYDRVYHVVMHVKEGSAAEAYAQRYHIRYDYEQDAKNIVYEEKTAEIDSLKYTYRLYNNHVEIIGIESETYEKLPEPYVMPSTIEDKKVTKILDINFYYGFYNTKTIVLPEYLEEMDDEWCKYYRVTDFQISETNKAFTSVDGVIYSKDMKTLICYPKGKTEETYVVPEGVQTIKAYSFYGQDFLRKVSFPQSLETIEEHAFWNIELTKVDWNEGLKSIGEYAFYGACLTDLNLPDSITTISSGAFSNNKSFKNLHLPKNLKNLGYFSFAAGKDSDPKLDTLTMPANLTTFNAAAFSGLKFSQFKVDEKNEALVAEKEWLLSKNRRTVVLCASLSGKQVTIPEGVEIIGRGAFSLNTDLTDVYCPASLSSLPANAFEKVDGEYKVTVHVKKGSYLINGLKEAGIPYQEYK